MRKQKNYIGSNLKFLRERKKKTQTELANTLGVTRAKINAFENGVNLNPTVEDLGKFTEHFKISVDSLLWVNLKRLTELQIRNLEAGNDEYVMGTKIRVLATTIDSRNKDNIEIVPLKAKAGYLSGYGNPEFIETLQTFQFPILSSNKKYRMFQIEGDSMLPFKNGEFIICEYIENWLNLKNSELCVVLTKEEGIVFKEVENNIELNRTVKLKSLNKEYNSYSIRIDEVLEVWKFVRLLSADVPESLIQKKDLEKLFDDLKNRILKD